MRAGMSARSCAAPHPIRKFERGPHWRVVDPAKRRTRRERQQKDESGASRFARPSQKLYYGNDDFESELADTVGTYHYSGPGFVYFLALCWI